MEVECKIWASKGMNIYYEVRENRKGYKAGALKEGMQYGYVQQCDFVAIFDADFQPESDFLMRTIPFLVHNPRVSLVQARWEFGRPFQWNYNFLYLIVDNSKLVIISVCKSLYFLVLKF